MRSVKTVFFLLFLEVFTAWAGDGPDFSRYPQFNPGRNPDGSIDLAKAMNEGGFEYFAKAHLAADFFERTIGDIDQPPHADEPLLLAISSLDQTGEAATEFFVTKSGHLSHCFDVWNWAIQGGSHRQLTEQQFADLRKKISTLPRENSYPAIKDGLAIVSFRDGEKWITRTCQKADVRDMEQFLATCFGFILSQP